MDLVLRHGDIENHFFRKFFEKEYNKVVVRVSGGLDSALILYLFAKFAEEKNPNLEIYCFTALDTLWTFGDTEGTSKNVVKFVQEQFPSIKIEHKFFPFTRQGYSTERLRKFSNKWNKSMKGKNSIVEPILNQYVKDTDSPFACIGTTKNISLDVTEEYENFEDYPGTDLTRKTLKYCTPAGPPASHRNNDGRTYRSRYGGIRSEENMPWWGLDKTFVAHQYKVFDLMNTLYPMTESCVYAPHLKNENYNIEKPPCKMCYWCNERYFSFGSYDYGVE